MLQLSAIYVLLIVTATVRHSTASSLACAENFDERIGRQFLHQGCIIRDLVVTDSSALEDIIFPNEPFIALYKPTIAANVSQALLLKRMTAVRALVVYGGQLPEVHIWPGLERLVLFESETHSLVINPDAERYNLRVFKVWKCLFDAIPASVNRLGALISFEIYLSGVESVDLAQFSGLSHLVHIGLVRNKIAEAVTSKPVYLPKLTSLALNNNNITAVDTRLWRMPKLTLLNLTGNKLRYVVGLERLEQLQMLELYNNRLNCGWLTEAKESLKKATIAPEMLQPCPSADNVEQHEFCCIGDRTDPAFQDYLLANETDVPPAEAQ